MAHVESVIDGTYIPDRWLSIEEAEAELSEKSGHKTFIRYDREAVAERDRMRTALEKMDSAIGIRELADILERRE